jgi:hypothetical protein
MVARLECKRNAPSSVRSLTPTLEAGLINAARARLVSVGEFP